MPAQLVMEASVCHQCCSYGVRGPQLIAHRGFGPLLARASDEPRQTRESAWQLSLIVLPEAMPKGFEFQKRQPEIRNKASFMSFDVDAADTV